MVGALSYDARLMSDICLSPTSGLSREQMTKIGSEVGHVTRKSDTTFKDKRSKVNLQGHIVAAYCTACYFTFAMCYCNQRRWIGSGCGRQRSDEHGWSEWWWCTTWIRCQRWQRRRSRQVSSHDRQQQSAVLCKMSLALWCFLCVTFLVHFVHSHAILSAKYASISWPTQPSIPQVSVNE